MKCSMYKTSIYIREIDKKIATHFVQTYHYSQIMPRLTKYYLGIFNEIFYVEWLHLDGEHNHSKQ